MFVRQNYILCFLLLCLGPNISAFSQDYNTVEEDIEKLNRLMEEYFRQDELEKLAALYLDDAYLISPGRTVTGRDNIDKYWTDIKEPVDWQLEVIEVTQDERELYRNEYYEALERKPPGWRQRGIELDHDKSLVYQLGRSTLKSRSATGEINTSIVNFIVIWQVQPDGTYRILLDTYSW